MAKTPAGIGRPLRYGSAASGPQQSGKQYQPDTPRAAKHPAPAAPLADFKLPHMVLTWTRCGRKGRYNVARLIEKHGTDMPISDFIDMIGPELPALDAAGQPSVLRPRMRRSDIHVSAAAGHG